ncbi:FAD-binding oxidoreductase [Leifsonia xyli]|uniref:FAD-binding oxidoreductase n=1 Tax=Leifsonia xyli TaxID=1575 RepID=UPI003D6681D7
MGIELDTNAVARLRDSVTGTVYVRGDEGLAAEVSCFNPAIRHDPDIVVAVAGEDDVVEAVRFAREAGLPVRVQATGHGAESPISGGMIVSTRGLDGLSVDPATGLARIGAGLRWAPVIIAAAEHGLAPITGSSTSVGAVGYTLGGGIGPLARRYGFTADWVRAFRVATADGRIVTADRDTNEDLFWGLRGGKGGLGVVTEMTLELVPLRSLYGGSVFFDGGAIEPALRAWIDWSAELPDEATTSIALLNVPDMDGPPPPLRGRTVLSVRFAYPGDPEEGERLFAPIRAAAPVYLDFVGEMPTTAMASIHNDPEEGGPTWIRGFMLDTFDQDAGDVILELAGPGSGAPFLAVEIRQIGGATARDTDDGTAVGGRDSGYTLSLLAADPSTFAEAAPARALAIAEALRDRISVVTNVNFAGDLADAAAFEKVWPPAVSERLASARAEWDPERVFAFGPS